MVDLQPSVYTIRPAAQGPVAYGFCGARLQACRVDIRVDVLTGRNGDSLGTLNGDAMSMSAQPHLFYI
jgi:hypothetical protein